MDRKGHCEESRDWILAATKPEALVNVVHNDGLPSLSRGLNGLCQSCARTVANTIQRSTAVYQPGILRHRVSHAH